MSKHVSQVITPSASLYRRHVLVTGGASGIGRATTLMLAQSGAKVAVLDIDQVRLDEIESSTGAVVVGVDLSDGMAVTRAVELAANRLGALDGIVNCAGISNNDGLADLTPDMWARSLAVNLTAPYLILRAALPWLLAGEGPSVVNIASGVGILPSDGAGTAYASSKAGLIGLTRSLARELAPKVRVNAVCPGLTATPMTSAYINAPRPNSESPAAGYALRRVADPVEIANAIVFLLSDCASFITGSTLAVDGGRIFH